MTYNELKDSINARYKMDATLANVPYTVLQDNWIYQLITQAESEIQRKTLVLTASDDVTVGSTETNTLPYSLPADFGKIRQLIDSDGNIYE